MADGMEDFVIVPRQPTAAVDVLLDQRFFQLESAQYKEFLRVLDEPPMPTMSRPCLQRSLND